MVVGDEDDDDYEITFSYDHRRYCYYHLCVYTSVHVHILRMDMCTLCCMDSYMHICIGIHMQAYMHAYTFPNLDALYANLYMYIHIHVYSFTYTYLLTYLLAYLVDYTLTYLKTN